MTRPPYHGITSRLTVLYNKDRVPLQGFASSRTTDQLNPNQNVTSGDSPVHLKSSNYVSSLSQNRIEVEYKRSPPFLYCCDVGSSSSHHLPYYQHLAVVDVSFEIEPIVSCNLACCMDGHVVTAVASCYQETSLRRSCYSDSDTRLYCYSPREYSSEITSAPEHSEELSSPFKRQHCTLSCCYKTLPSSKNLCPEAEGPIRTNCCHEMPPEETPFCLVKPKRILKLILKKDAILLKPYLNNPVSRPIKEYAIQRSLSPVSSQSIIINNNCQLSERRQEPRLYSRVEPEIGGRILLTSESTGQFVFRDLGTSPYVFLRHDAIGTPLQLPYDGPCQVIQRGERNYTIRINNRNVIVSIDRLKPAFLLDDNIEHQSIEDHDVIIIPLGVQTEQSER